MKRLSKVLLDIHHREGNMKLTLFKSNVAKAYCLLPIHPHWQIKQVNTISFNALVTWIAKNKKKIPYLSVYSNDTVAPDYCSDLVWYEHFYKFLPNSQKQLLDLWTELGIPFKEKKQILGPKITIIGIDIDVDMMTFSLPEESKCALMDKIRQFIAPSKSSQGFHHSLRRWQHVAGWINWAFNVSPLLCPCLNTFYPKIKGKDKPAQDIWLNNSVCTDLSWALNHIQKLSGVHLLSANDWGIDNTNITIYCNACMDGMGFWYPGKGVGYMYNIVDSLPTQYIFYWKALCVLSTFFFASKTSRKPKKILIYTNNTNTMDIFNSLRCLPQYNKVLKTSVDICLESNHQLWVLHIPGEENIVADALSRRDLNRALATAPHLKLISSNLPSH
ncbi:hypothetical protein B0H34DRAFT_785123 [Crassisporium funariophilum]|nr:hypothetical protein B0H34DRAFT_785123 [Crassisporium funariophilum]